MTVSATALDMKKKMTRAARLVSPAGLIAALLCLLALTSCRGADVPSHDTTPAEERESTLTAEQTSAPETELPTPEETEPETETGPETEPETEEETLRPTLYQLAPDAASLTMGYVLRTAHNKLIVVDGGGYDGVSLKDTPSYLPAALRAIAGVGEGEYFEVEAWILTHAHIDHIYELSKTLRDYTADSNYAINHIYFDFPDFDEGGYAGYSQDFRLSCFRENLNAYGEVIGAGENYYDKVNAAVVNEDAIAGGLSLEIDGVKIQFLQTWSEADGHSNFNDTSLIFRLWVEGQSILILGDAGDVAGKRLEMTYGEALKSDLVQMAHHGQAGVDGLCYAAIDAQVHLWPTPVWVWRNDSGQYKTDATRTWLYGESFLEPDEYNIVAGLYDKYPRRPLKVSEWVKVLPGMALELPYVLPFRPGVNGGPAPDFGPVDTPYVKEGLVHCYSGEINTRGGHDNEAAAWEDLVSGYDYHVRQDGTTYFTDKGLFVSSRSVFFPVKVLRVLNGEEFTVELLISDFKSVGTTFNAVFCSSNEHINLFRRNAGDVLELKFFGDNNNRIRIPKALSTLQDALITITFRQGGTNRVYVNGKRAGEVKAPDTSLGVPDLFIGYPSATSGAEAVYRSIRFYDRALTPEECAANARVDGVMK